MILYLFFNLFVFMVFILTRELKLDKVRYQQYVVMLIFLKEIVALGYNYVYS